MKQKGDRECQGWGKYFYRMVSVSDKIIFEQRTAESDRTSHLTITVGEVEVKENIEAGENSK